MALRLEREDIARVATLYRASNEAVESMNQRMLEQIKQ